MIAYGVVTNGDIDWPQLESGGQIQSVSVNFAEELVAARPQSESAPRELVIGIIESNVRRYYEQLARDERKRTSALEELGAFLNQIERQRTLQAPDAKSGKVSLAVRAKPRQVQRQGQQIRPCESGVAISACVNNSPGILHLILSALTRTAAENRHFRFNIDYFRTVPSYDEGSQDIEIFGRYLSKGVPGSVSEINGLVIYGAYRHPALLENWFGGLEQALKDMELVVKHNSTLPPQLVYPLRGFRRKTPVDHPKGQYPKVSNCSISRRVTCPEIEDRHGGGMGRVAVRITATILDAPGSLRSLLEVIGST